MVHMESGPHGRTDTTIFLAAILCTLLEGTRLGMGVDDVGTVRHIISAESPVRYVV